MENCSCTSPSLSPSSVNHHPSGAILRLISVRFSTRIISFLSASGVNWYRQVTMREGAAVSVIVLGQSRSDDEIDL